MSKLKILLPVAALLALVAVMMATGAVSAGDPTGGGGGIIGVLLP